MDGTAPDKLAQLEADVRAARDELAATVDEITDWFDPKTRMTAAVDRGRHLVHDFTDPAADPADRARARVVLGVAAAGAAAVVAGVIRRLARR